MDKKYVIGIDFGTLSVRAAAFRTDSGEEAASASYAYPHGCMDECLPDGTAVEPLACYQDPREYEEGLGNVIRSVLEKGRIDPKSVLAVGTDFTFCTVLPLTREGTPLCYLDKYRGRTQAYVKLWKHHSAQAEADRINETAQQRGESFLSWSGGTVSPEYLLPKVWETLHRDPDLFAETSYFLEAGDWITFRMTGTMVRNLGMAGYRGLYAGKDPSDAFLCALDPNLLALREKIFSIPVRSPGTIAGFIDAAGAARTGLQEGTPVAVCQGDSLTTVAATGVTESGILASVIGTSACQLTLSREFHEVPGSNGCIRDGILPGFYGLESGQCCVGDHFSWLEEHLVPEAYRSEAAERKISVLELLTEKASRLKPGQSGLLALDWWNGTRSTLMDGELTGMILGMNLQTRAEDIFRALVEATAFGNRMIVENYTSHGVRIEKCVAAGGIAQKNRMLLQIYADVLNRDIALADTAECGALGSAVYALTAAGEECGIQNATEAIQRLVKPIRCVIHPIPANVGIYDRLYQEYRKLYLYFGTTGTNPMKNMIAIRKEAGLQSPDKGESR
ncbi:MAG: ribulokinase [Clostridia bacterium]|nr:ribulokinase [Clostridia bacterium]